MQHCVPPHRSAHPGYRRSLTSRSWAGPRGSSSSWIPWRRGQELFISFARTLDQSTLESDVDDDVDWIVGRYVSHARAIDPGVLNPLLPPPYSAFVNDLERNSTRKHDGHSSIETLVLKRRRLSSFSDLQGPLKYSRSAESQATYNASTKFDITHNNREPLTYLIASSPARKPGPKDHPKPLTKPDLDKLIKDLYLEFDYSND
ncbi:uncharacterized protein LACBIDRAFT_334531 [Laccaria bicolor S238N-H82]|uniref:Predicted protein n=1 Tax=Laccaria bicolor (strain S238N-H82 / ATCC MYA-4686) TaxID=486041 RepID=B0DZF6_LACBS|nr:uncharacterized protein LACBIDRAFT_334531 [Laccaria bicolor S238N-H82]EDR00036.1 predicted protein [Laccaria bicolor S238N-H82]|eukprot:XP_001889345.1 predicted protein [Laccaria bicolor S238N-H82]